MGEAAAARSRRHRPAVIAAAVLAAVVTLAWALQTATSGGAGEAEGSPAPYSVRVERGGVVLRQYDLAELHALPVHTAVIEGREQDGPLLAAVLREAGVARYEKVVVRGAGLRDGGRLELTARQVRQGVQLDFSERGTVKVCGPELVWPAWVRDVLIISVD
jgi:hypothetical protein